MQITTGHALSDGVRLYYESVGSGPAILFLHEYAGDCRSWDDQVRAMSRSFRCVTCNARGYPPSDVPPDPDAYSSEQAADDAIAVLDHLGIERAHLVGLSMGGFAALQAAIRHPERVLSAVVAGAGTGAEPEIHAKYRQTFEASAREIAEQGMQAYVDRYCRKPDRISLQAKDPKAWERFRSQMLEHDPEGSKLTLRGVQARRPSLWEMKSQLERISVPIQLIVGDRDLPVLRPNLMLNETLPDSRLAVLPASGHAVNLEEPMAFNRIVLDFLLGVLAGTREP